MAQNILPEPWIKLVQIIPAHDLDLNRFLQVLINHIRDKLPDMKARLNTLIGQAQQELNSFGDAAVFGDKNQVGFIVLAQISGSL